MLIFDSITIQNELVCTALFLDPWKTMDSYERRMKRMILPYEEVATDDEENYEDSG